ncbi:leucine-rich repeat protein [uncultured Eubacterium sp.]|uniref:InlB B-repeat-containing protein n=1 Tax=uncultured Eubacterium sp. TaxID=165185 RepID=UPI0025CF2DCB|nr:leucine-rich repeat protein [uncultured Eubacterium sp.]
MKKFISLFMAFVMLLSVTAGLNLTAYAETATSGKCGDNVYWSYDSTTNTLTISGKGAMDDYGSHDPAYSSYLYKPNSIDIVIKEGVTSIGSHAFYNHMHCNNVRIPLSVTNIKKFAFHEDLRVPEMDEELEMYSYNSESLVAYSNEYVINNVLYAGNEEQWKKIGIDVGNETLTNAKIHYNSPLPEQPDDGTSKDYIKNDFISDDKPFKGKHGYCYSDSYFDQSATKYNQSLATMSLCLAFSTYSPDDEVKNKDNNTEKMLKECGYKKYEQYHFNEKPERESIGCAIASKEYNGNTIIAVAVRSGGYAAEWASNLKLKSVDGNGKNDHEGFDKSSDKVESYIMQYIQSKNITGNVKIWITGFSRGAAVATQTAAKLQNGLAYVKDGTYVSAEFDKNSVYAYGFATPAGAIKDNKPNSSKYNNIFNIIEYNDPVPLIAPERWDYTRYGQTRVLPFRESTDSKKYNKYIKQIKKEMGDDWKVDDFKSYIYNYLLGLNNPLGYVPVIEQKNNHDTLGTYNRKLIKDISKGIGSADKYYKLYQSDIMDFAAKYKGEDEKDKDEKDKDEKDKNKKGVDITIILGQLVRLLPTAIVHSHITTTFLGNKSILADVHANQKYYLYWMQLMDKNYSNNLPVLFTDGDFRKIIVNCPVDIKVYDSNNTLVASIINDEPQEIEDSSIVSSVDDNNQKVVYLPQDEEYRVEVTSREDCQTTYTIEELAGVDSDVSRVVTYDSLAMKQGDTITSTINRYTQDEIDNVVDNGSSADYKTKLNNQVVSSDVDAKGSEVEKYTYNVTVTSNSEDCSAVGSGTFNIGEFAQVEAVPADNYTFDGWYIDGKKVSSDASYRFAVKSNVNIEAKFKSVETGGSTGGGGTSSSSVPNGTDKKDDETKPETKPNQSQNTSTSATQKLSVKKLVSKKKALVVYWNKIADVSGYQIQVATDKKFKKNKKTVTVAKQNASKKTVKKLKAKKKYFVRVRAYKNVDGKKSYGKWSKIKSVKTK